mmetsp:Transcript_45212/g.105439  ORF Transcript_45212/g.105439 Transcript_45212/m.105439 type:complete len:326 (+) Transcript_45212:118-1095(+)
MAGAGDLARRLDAAWESCRLIEASRLIQESQRSRRQLEEIFEPKKLEAIQRVEAVYTQSLDELMQPPASGWKKDRDEQRDLDLYFRLTSDTTQAVARTRCTGRGIGQTFDALREYIMQADHNGDNSVRQLGPAFLQDSLLQVRRRGHGTFEDNILHFSCADALEEPLGALWLSLYTPSGKRARTARTWSLPKPEAGSVRLSFWRGSFVISPIWPNSAAMPLDAKRIDEEVVRDVEVTYAVARRPSSAACTFESVMHKEVANRLFKFKEYLQIRSEIPKSFMSQYIKRHLMQCAADAKEVSFKDLAKMLPDDWADYHDPEHVNDFR